MAEGDGDRAQGRIRELVRLGRGIHLSRKVQKVVELLKASTDRKIVFVNYLATLEYLQRVLREHGIPHAVYHGSLSAGAQTGRHGGLSRRPAGALGHGQRR